MDLNYKELTIYCSSCKFDIIDVLDRNSNNKKKFRVRCPKCKELSFYINVSEDIAYNEYKGVKVTDILDANGYLLIETKLC